MNTLKWWEPRRLVLPLTIGIIFVIAIIPLKDPDLFWHLANGRLIFSSHAIPRTDPFSFTMYGKEWICHEWLSDVAMYIVYDWFGPAVLAIAGGAVVAASFGLVAARCPASPFIAAFCTLLAAFASAPLWGTRPQMISLLLASLTLYIAEGRGPLWILVPLGALWANLHGGFFLGTVIVGVFAVGAAIDVLRKKDRAGGWKAVTAPVLATIGMAASPLLSPYGIRLLVYPFETLFSPAMREYIIEWFSPDFHKVAFQPLALLLLALMASLALSKKRPSSTHLLLLLGTTYAALSSGRHVPLFAIVAAPVLSGQLANLGPRHRVGASDASADGSARKLLARRPSTPFGVTFALLVAAVLVVSFVWRLRPVVSADQTDQAVHSPIRALQFMQNAGLGGNLFNKYSWGGYLIWHGELVFIDGRADVYGDEFLRQYMHIYRGLVSPDSVFQQYDIARVLIEPGSALATLLEGSPDWSEVYRDEKAIVFTRAQAT
ncbi:MAG TPA: hypothetical protein VMY98_07930 [Anaerolineae bacterium]|nr:hypothetical protein [Anaerolineae bacterium]